MQTMFRNHQQLIARHTMHRMGEIGVETSVTGARSQRHDTVKLTVRALDSVQCFGLPARRHPWR